MDLAGRRVLSEQSRETTTTNGTVPPSTEGGVCLGLLIDR